jgi:hypothetical protein
MEVRDQLHVPALPPGEREWVGPRAGLAAENVVVACLNVLPANRLQRLGGYLGDLRTRSL